jgi:hypothetical protein
MFSLLKALSRTLLLNTFEWLVLADWMMHNEWLVNSEVIKTHYREFPEMVFDV